MGRIKGCRKKKIKLSNTPYFTKAPTLRDTHNTVWVLHRLLKSPHRLFKGTIARSVRSHGPAMQAWYYIQRWTIESTNGHQTNHYVSLTSPCFMALHTSLSTSN